MSLPILLIFSSNLDFFEIVDNKIKLKKTMRLGNPICESVVEDGGQLFSTRLTKESIMVLLKCAQHLSICMLYIRLGKYMKFKENRKLYLSLIGMVIP